MAIPTGCGLTGSGSASIGAGHPPDEAGVDRAGGRGVSSARATTSNFGRNALREQRNSLIQLTFYHQPDNTRRSGEGRAFARPSVWPRPVRCLRRHISAFEHLFQRRVAALEGDPQPSGRGSNQEITNHSDWWSWSGTPYAGIPANDARLSPRAPGSAHTPPPGGVTLTNSSASDSTLLSPFGPLHTAASLQRGSHSSKHRIHDAGAVATQ